MPWSASSNSESQNSRRDCGSTALVGSSRNSRSGLCSTVPASARRCFWPPDSVPASCLRCWPKPEALDELVDARPRLRARHVVHGGEEREVLVDREVFVQRELLRHVADAALQRLGVARDLVAEHVDLAGGRVQQAAEHADRRRLAGAVRPEEAVDLAPAHREIEAVDGGHVRRSASTGRARGWPSRRSVMALMAQRHRRHGQARRQIARRRRARARPDTRAGSRRRRRARSTA